MRRGTLLGGRYRLDDLLSENHGARFWRGTDTVLDRSVGVNVLPADDERLDLVLEAVRASAAVTDPRTLHVLDCARDHEVVWVVSEWGEGTSLDVVLQQGPLPASRAAWLAREVADSIAHAHQTGVAHGRLTPESVLVTDAGAVKLIGFAISRAIEGPRPGTAVYNAPGLIEADVIDLAGILYAAVTGRWSGISTSAVPPAPRDSRGPLRPRQVRAGVPRLLDAICERVLRKEASEHLMPLESALEIFAALSEHVGDPSAVAPMDAASLRTEPTVGLDRERLREVITGATRASQYERNGTQGWATDGLPMIVPDPTTDSRPAAPENARDALAPFWFPDEQAVVSTPMAFANDPAFDPDEQPVPPEPFVDSEANPLFAKSERRVPPGAPKLPTGVDESAWLRSPGAPRRPAARKRRLVRLPWWAIAAAILVVGIVVVVAVAILHSAGGTPSAAPSGHVSASAGTTASPPVRIVAIHDFDPEGDPPRENPEQVGLALDGDPATGWQTSTYRGTAALGNIKSGVGLLLDFGSDQSVSSVDLTLTGTPTSLSIYTAPPGTVDTPTDLSSLAQVAGITADQRATTIRLGSEVKTRFLVVWLTRLPAVNHGYRGQIDEVTVRS